MSPLTNIRDLIKQKRCNELENKILFQQSEHYVFKFKIN